MSSKAVVLQTAGSGSLANHSHVQHCTTRSCWCGDIAARACCPLVRLLDTECALQGQQRLGWLGWANQWTHLDACMVPSSLHLIPPGVDPTSRFREDKLLRPILAPFDLHLPHEYHHGQLGAGQTGLSQAAVGRQHVIPSPPPTAPRFPSRTCCPGCRWWSDRCVTGV